MRRNIVGSLEECTKVFGIPRPNFIPLGQKIQIMWNCYLLQIIPHGTDTCSDGELYFLDMCFLMVSFTDFTFFPREIRDGVGERDMSLMSLLSFYSSQEMCQNTQDSEH